MTKQELIYLVFGIVIVVSLIFDLGLMSRKGKAVTIKQALFQTFFWVILALSFGLFILYEDGRIFFFEYLSAYLMEWSLSIDNIFVFILIFSAFNVKEIHYGRTLIIGILMAIVFRIIFITVGVALVDRFHWILYIFGLFLVYTGYKMFSANEEAEFDPQKSVVYKWMQRFLPLVPHDGGGKYIITENHKKKFTILFVVIIMLAAIDLVFALDSIPAVMGISRDRMIIYTSNIFAVLGLRSLFFLLRGAVNKFDYLQQGIAIVLVFIGVKMLAEHWLNQWISKSAQVGMSLGVIVLCISGSIIYSLAKNRKGLPPEGDGV
ncbi:MAG TPA: TerC/Alx family metal homeostasis membrane protein [Niabella sp.]|jgi:tellurite resistance protein TerC|nr:TerC/Alx family metal homeostasis membrane protein [Chitinophagaceae bacterium]HRN46847.1 TerC/Alx family metal homeostasis membrane protein [Niabella sp.]HRO83568.1 TerC/Alx family metal homeostasis membrane protein [Niabella sp.]HUN01361.1 TerC/Alx family metal homeostasis membrane protein [Niabella sp.]